MRVSVLIENTLSESNKGLVAEHGLSFFIEFEDKKILLDAGTTDAFIGNADVMGIDVDGADFCVLSHGHYDHSGGFGTYLSRNSDKKIYAMNTAKDKYFSTSGGTIHEIGIPENVYPKYRDNFIFLDGITQIAKDIYVIPHSAKDLREIGQRAKLYKMIEGQYVPDDFSHEHSLVFDTKNGLIIFNSCSHGGIVNIIDEIYEYFGNDKKLLAFFGGLHMKGKAGDVEICTFSEEEVQKMADYLIKSDLKKLYTGHCTGIPAFELIKKYMGDKVEYISTGMNIVL
ncbi:MAG: MBL fold metallo-hydrolase [Lachnospiraceae bacterium]|nr:MBL fold metallo-hydrolase [Lachnospiraceae bacterium]